MDPASPRQRKPLSPLSPDVAARLHTVPPHRDVRTPEQKRRQHAGKRSPPASRSRASRSPASTAGTPPEGVPKLAATLQGAMEDAGLTEGEMTLLKAEGIVAALRSARFAPKWRPKGSNAAQRHINGLSKDAHRGPRGRPRAPRAPK